MNNEEKHEAQLALNELNRKKDVLIQRKMEIQTALSRLSANVRGRHLDRNRYQSICDEQADLKQELHGIERQVIGLSAEIRDESQKAFAPKKSTDAELQIIPTLVALRDEYESFAADATRVSSMRRMASEFTQKLTLIIRKL